METHWNMKNMSKQQSLQALAKPATKSGSEKECRTNQRGKNVKYYPKITFVIYSPFHHIIVNHQSKWNGYELKIEISMPLP